MAEVKIYTTPSCGYCAMAKKFFKDRGIDYTEINVAADAQEREKMIKKTGQMGVPVIEIGKETIIGFDKKKISELLGI